MYKSTFDFQGQGDTTLCFSTGDEFNLIEQVNEHWWLMQSSTGATGLVPSSYLAVNKTVKSEILESIDRAIDLIHKNAAKRGGPLKADERHNLQKLLAHRKNVQDDKAVGTIPNGSTQQANQDQKKTEQPATKQPEESIYMELPDQPKRLAPSPPRKLPDRNSQTSRSRRQAPAPPSTPRPTESQARKARGPSTASFSSNDDGDLTKDKKVNHERESKSDLKQTEKKNDKEVIYETKTIYVESKCKEQHVSSISVSDSLGLQLVSKVKERIGIDEGQAQQAVRCVLEGMKDSISSLSTIMDKMITSIPYIPPKNESFGPEFELCIILDEISKRKNDSQQRSWALHEDFHAIQNLLTKLLKILAEGSTEISKKVLKEDDYHYLNDLIVYYQMEPRIGLRILLIQTFGCCCQFGYEFVSQLLCSVLPTELAKELTETENISNYLNVALLLTMLFSTGESPPLHHYAQFNDDFIDFVFECIERPPIVDEYDQIPDGLISVLLAFNQHFKQSSDNKVLQVMANRAQHTTFTEKILLLINRDDDPVSLFEYHKPDPSSVLKMFQDIFSLKETANIFFTNDLMVLIDIILRQLTDRNHGDKIRTQFLSLFYDIITNSNYTEHRHRSNEFGECFTSILVDEDNNTADDKYIVRNISAEFNSLFPIFI